MTKTTTTHPLSPIEIVQETIRRRRTAAGIIQKALADDGHQTTVDPNTLIVRPKGVFEITANKGALADQIWDLMYPHAPVGEFFHYSDMAGFKGIIGDGLLRLTYLTKRMAEDTELRTHARRHRWRGYLDTSAGPDYADTLAKDIFYTSFTPTNSKNEREMWRDFGGHSRGVRLRLQVEVDRARPHRGELRAIKYLTGEKTLLNRINDDLAAAGLPEFLPWKASKIGAFGLPSGSLDVESEIRLLVKHHQGAPDIRKTDGAREFLEVPINQDNDIATVTLLGIEAGPDAAVDVILKAAEGSSFANIPVVRAPRP
jgi:hypothetical protein